MSGKLDMAAWRDETDFCVEEVELGVFVGFDLEDLSRAVQIWALGQPDPKPTILEIAKSFRVRPTLIVRAIQEHGSAFFHVIGPDDDFSKMRVDHDGI